MLTHSCRSCVTLLLLSTSRTTLLYVTSGLFVLIYICEQLVSVQTYTTGSFTSKFNEETVI